MIKEKSFNICLHSEILVASHKEKVIVINNIRNLQIASFMSTRSIFLLVYINKVHLFSQFSFILKDKENSEQNLGIHNHYNIVGRDYLLRMLIILYAWHGEHAKNIFTCGRNMFLYIYPQLSWLIQKFNVNGAESWWAANCFFPLWMETQWRPLPRHPRCDLIGKFDLHRNSPHFNYSFPTFVSIPDIYEIRLQMNDFKLCFPYIFHEQRHQ